MSCLVSASNEEDVPAEREGSRRRRRRTIPPSSGDVVGTPLFAAFSVLGRPQTFAAPNDNENLFVTKISTPTPPLALSLGTGRPLEGNNAADDMARRMWCQPAPSILPWMARAARSICRPIFQSINLCLWFIMSLLTQ